MPKRGKSEEFALSEGQLKQLIAVCSEPTDRVLIMLMALCGLRVSEAIHLNMGWIKEGCVVIPGFMPCRCWECSAKGHWEPKTKAGARTIPLPAVLKPVLMEYLKAHPEGLEMTRQTANNRVRVLQGKAGLPHIFPHALRASYATLLATKGMNAAELCIVMGWSRISMGEYYIQLTQAKAGAKQKLKEIFG